MVYLVDDNHPFRRSTTMLLETAGLEVRDFEAGAAALAHLEQVLVPGGGACVVSDVRMPDMSGIELLEEIKRRDLEIPVIFITGHGDVPLAVEAMRRGAINFIEKPFAAHVLIEAIRLAPSHDSRPHYSSDPTRTVTTINSKIATLTKRERQVLELVVAGKFNKTIAYALGISIKTVELHRSSFMAKLGVRNVPDLVKMFLGYQ
jgi:two-component system, LuxR family, response regulator FixJ